MSECSPVRIFGLASLLPLRSRNLALDGEGHAVGAGHTQRSRIAANFATVAGLIPNHISNHEIIPVCVSGRWSPRGTSFRGPWSSFLFFLSRGRSDEQDRVRANENATLQMRRLHSPHMPCWPAVWSIRNTVNMVQDLQCMDKMRRWMCDYLLKLGWPGVWFGGAAAGRASEPGVALMLRTGDGSMMDGQRRRSQLSSAITEGRIVREFGCPVGVFLAYTRRKVGVRPTLRIILAREAATLPATLCFLYVRYVRIKLSLCV